MSKAATVVPPWRRKSRADDHAPQDVECHQDAGHDQDAEHDQDAGHAEHQDAGHDVKHESGMAQPVVPEWPDAWVAFRPQKVRARWDPYMVASASSASSSSGAAAPPPPPPPHGTVSKEVKPKGSVKSEM